MKCKRRAALIATCLVAASGLTACVSSRHESPGPIDNGRASQPDTGGPAKSPASQAGGPADQAPSRQHDGQRPPSNAKPVPVGQMEAVYELLCRYDFSLQVVQEDLGPESLPILYEMLQQRKYWRAWICAITAIAFLGEDDRSYAAIIEFVQRVDDWNGLITQDAVNLIMGKIGSFRWLPFTDPARGTETLRRILLDSTEAEGFLAEWHDSSMPPGLGDKRRAVLVLRGSAAWGLVAYDSESNVALVRREYEAAKRAVEEIPSPNTPEGRSVTENQAIQNGYKDMFATRLANALAVSEYISEHGREEFLANLGTDELREEVKFHYRMIISDSAF